jgi:flagellar basal-body rod protein FlgF
MDNAQLVAHSRLQALQRQLDVLSNNIANSSTTGFKARDMRFSEYVMPKAKSDGFSGAARAISFTMDGGMAPDFTDGAVERTGNTTDIALRGSTLLAVKTPQGERYTRNGSLMIDTKNQLVTSDGYPVLGDNGPILADPVDGPVEITSDGSVGNRGGSLGKLKLVDVPDPSKLSNIGANLFGSATPLAQSKAPTLVVGALEKSNVQPVLAMSRLVEVSRAYTAIATMMQKLDDTQKNALDRLSTVPA